ncbi:MAG: zinc ribbon domain-containing protein [Cyanobacteria bacterium J06632_22]
MPSCPRCQQSVSATAIDCPTCRLPLKAHGHPGMPLHRSVGSVALCETCTYHFDDTCTFPQRPQAQTCTLYHDRRSQPQSPTYTIPWQRKYAGWIALAGLLVVSLVVSLLL